MRIRSPALEATVDDVNRIVAVGVEVGDEEGEKTSVRLFVWARRLLYICIVPNSPEYLRFGPRQI
jgi:hypothetical protein